MLLWTKTEPQEPERIAEFAEAKRRWVEYRLIKLFHCKPSDLHGENWTQAMEMLTCEEVEAQIVDMEIRGNADNR